MKKIVLLALLFLSMHSFAQWNYNPAMNNPICTDSTKQIDPRIMEDGAGGAYITWKDYRPANFLPDIYIQRIDAKGFVKWIINGINLCNETHDQSTPAICSDMKGGAIIAWSDWRSSIERDLYAQRIDSNGNVKWLANGANVSDLTYREHSEKIISDENGGAILIFEKQVLGVWDIWAQHLDSNGTKLWGQGGVAVCSAVGNKRNHRVCKDGRGGAIISWQDLRNGLDYDIYAQRLDANGIQLWGAYGMPVGSTNGDQLNAKIDPDSASHGAIISWQDTRMSMDYDIYIQKIDSNGNAVWATNGNIVCDALGNQSALDFLTVDSSGETIITWKDARNGSEDIYVQKLNKNGVAQWTANGKVISNAVLAQVNPNICKAQHGGAIIVWQDSVAGTGWDIKAQRITNNGQLFWDVNGLTVSSAFGEQNGPKNISDSKGGTIICWQDKRSGIFDIYAQHIWATGYTPLSTTNFTPNDKYTIYPNPANNLINIDANSEINKIKLINYLGEVVFERSYSNLLKIKLDVSKYATGFYGLILYSEGYSSSHKINIKN
jgi:hypothetical protein